MNKNVVMIPADKDGNKLFLKELRIDGSKVFVKYRSTYNDIPFVETQIQSVGDDDSFVICGDDGTVLWRISAQLIGRLL